MKNTTPARDTVLYRRPEITMVRSMLRGMDTPSFNEIIQLRNVLGSLFITNNPNIALEKRCLVRRGPTSEGDGDL